jgi:hypothetical protein
MAIKGIKKSPALPGLFEINFFSYFFFAAGFFAAGFLAAGFFAAGFAVFAGILFTPPLRYYAVYIILT